MSEKMQYTSEIAEEGGGGDCIDACACMKCIVRVAGQIDEKIASMDTTELSRGAFRIQNSGVFRKPGELRDEERMCRMDNIYIQGIDIINDLLMKRDKTVGFMGLDGVELSNDENRRFMADWKGFFYRMTEEKKCVHRNQGYSLRLSIRIVGSACSFILEKVSANTGI